MATETIDSVPFGRSRGLLVAALRCATVNLDNTVIDLVELQKPRGEPTDGMANRPGWMHLCFHVDERMTAAGDDVVGQTCTVVVGDTGTGAGHPRRRP